MSMRAGSAALILFLCSGCTFSFDWIKYWRAQNALIRQDYRAALPILEQIVDHQPGSDRAIEAARQGARVAHLEAKNYPVAIEFYRHLVLHAKDENERRSAQRFIAQIEFENLKDYDKAVVEYEKLLKLDNSPQETFRYRLNLAKSHFNLTNIDQALAELEQILAGKPGKDELFEIKMLKANVLVSSAKLNDAAAVWTEILSEFPERSKKENVGLNLVVCYEELKEFDKAIALLEQLKVGYPNPDFIELRITRLKERQANLPGAQGLKR